MMKVAMTGWLSLLIAATAAYADDAVVELDSLKSKVPAAWKPQKAAGMRKHHFKIAKAAGEAEDAEVVVFFFGKGQGGSADENIKRWKGQFKEPAAAKAKVEKFKVGEVPVTILDISGTMISRPPGDPTAPGVEKPDFRAINVVFASPNGPYFFNLRGPAKTVDDQKKAFEDWIKAFK